MSNCLYCTVATLFSTDASIQDDTKAIQKAMNDGKRCGAKCNGSTTKNAIIYFPPGQYLISSPIEVLYGSQVIGDVGLWLSAPI